MRKAVLAAAAALALTTLAACNAEPNNYQDAVDSDRTAREKMTAAINQMRDVHAFLKENAQRYADLVRAKQSEALDAYKIAVDSWIKAEKAYRSLLKDYPDDPKVVNNLANLLYNKVYFGLEADLEEAEALQERAVRMRNTKVFERNLELISELKESVETIRLVEENRKVVNELRNLLEAQQQ